MGYNNTFSWSYTKYETHEKCPLRYQHKYVDKDPRFAFETNIHTERGNKTHKLAENHTKGKIHGLPKELSKFRYEFNHIRRLGATAEEDWTVTDEWVRTHAKDWANAWCRGKADWHWYDEVAKILYIGDHKTGKVYASHLDQGHLMSTMGMHFYPEAKDVVTEFWYLDSGEVSKPLEFKASRKDEMSKIWQRRARKLQIAKVFEPKENGTCRFCPLYQTDECSATKL